MDAAQLAARLMSGLKEKDEGLKLTPSVVATGEGLPSPPKKCMEKILAREFVDFAKTSTSIGKGEVDSPCNGRPNRGDPCSRPRGKQEADTRPGDLGTMLQYLYGSRYH